MSGRVSIGERKHNVVRNQLRRLSFGISLRAESSFFLALALGVLLGGCSAESTTNQARKQKLSPSPLKSETATADPIPAEAPEPPPQPVVPAVHLSEQHRHASLVKQGDVLPNFRLADAEGTSHSLHSLLGDEMTVVCFWSSESPAAIQQLRDTGPEIVDPFAEQGLAVVSINYGQTPAEVLKVTEEADFAGKVLLDPKGQALAQVATRYLPRTYLVDGDGKIVWFDMEYSPSTRRHLIQAIECSLDEP